MRLIITRHGETEENKEGIVQGQIQGNLSAEGIEQAKKLALRLKDEHIDHIYSSDLERSSDTAKDIAAYHRYVPIEYVKELRERFLGEWQGKKGSDVDFSTTPKDGETPKALYARADAFLHQLLGKHQGKTILLVGHNGINKALIAVITGKKPEDIPLMENLKNTSICIYEIDENRNHKIEAFNCTKHLK